MVFALQKRPIDAGYIITTVVFFTPEERIMKATEAHQRGYGVGNTPTRVILRSSKSALATYTQTVSKLQIACFSHMPDMTWHLVLQTDSG